MGMPSASVQPGTQPQGKGFATPQPSANADVAGPSSISGQAQGKGGQTTNAATSGQPQMGQPNMYPNTVGQWDNASIQPQQSQNRGGKGKG
jgi:hypothetical protein